MTLDELKRAISMLRLLQKSEALALKAIVGSQIAFIDDNIFKPSRNRISAMLRKNAFLDDIYGDNAKAINSADVVSYNGFAVELKSNIDILTTQYSDVISEALSYTQTEYNGNPISLSSSQLQAINALDKSTVSYVFASNGGSIIQNILGCMREYVDRINNLKSVAGLEDIITEVSSDIFIEYESSDAMENLSLKRRLEMTYDDLTNCLTIYQFIEDNTIDRDVYLSKSFTNIRGDFGV